MSNGHGGSVTERGQHISNEGVSGDSGQRHITRDSELGKKAVPPSKPTADISTQSQVAREERK
jgi:hypothetical protein